MDAELDMHERYDVSDAGLLLEDTWARERDGSLACERCGVALETRTFRCPECGAIQPMCIGSCGACVSPRCVGGRLG